MTGPKDRATGRDHGFTLIELIVVVIVIGILAGIAIPVYLGVQRSARDASVVADVRNTSTLVTNWVLENPMSAVTNTADYVSSGGKVVQSTSTVVDVTVAASGAYTVCGYTSGGGTYSSNSSAYLINSAASTADRTTSGCPGDGVVSTPSPSPSASSGTGSSGGTSSGGTSSGGSTSTPSSSASATPTTGASTIPAASASASPSSSASPSASSSPTPSPSPSATSAAWVDCASEGGTCSFTGTHIVRYGLAPSSWVLKTLTDGTPCTNDVFGDPAYGYAKACSYQP